MLTNAMDEKAGDVQCMTVDAFLEWDDGTDARYDLTDGRVVASEPTEPMCQALLGRLEAELASRLPEGFRVHVHRGVRFEADPCSFRRPAAVVSSSLSEGACVQAPLLIFELLSPDNVTVDLDGQLFLYRQILTTQAIVLLRTDRPWARVWLPEGTHWVVKDVAGASRFNLPLLQSPLRLDDIYDTPDLWEPSASADPA